MSPRCDAFRTNPSDIGGSTVGPAMCTALVGADSIHLQQGLAGPVP